MSKLSAYQKLKVENQRLRQDIFKLLNRDPVTVMAYELQLKLEKTIWKGSSKMPLGTQMVCANLIL